MGEHTEVRPVFRAWWTPTWAKGERVYVGGKSATPKSARDFLYHDTQGNLARGVQIAHHVTGDAPLRLEYITAWRDLPGDHWKEYDHG